jgi:hypothetical protein
MLQPGDILVERLTGRRAIVITLPRPTATADELTVRFPDGRLEDRFVFELEQPPSFLGTMLELLATPLALSGTARARAPRAVPDRARPPLLRQV